MTQNTSNPIQEEREKCVRRCIPELFSDSYKSVLYIGANQKRQHFLDLFDAAGYTRIVIVEVFEQNYQFLKKKFEDNNSQLYKVIKSDVRDIDKHELLPFDVVFFWHGIEHLPEKEIRSTLLKLEKLATKIVILGMPWGKYKQEAEYGNPYEEHLSVIYPESLHQLGFNTETLGSPDEVGSNITAWKYTTK